jgi:DedD protein
MARPISDQELQLKKRARRRLVGAIVLVTAVAVVLPMVLDSEPQPVQQNVDIHIPSPDSAEFKPKPALPPPSTPIKGLPEGKSEAVAAAKADAAASAPTPSQPTEPPVQESKPAPSIASAPSTDRAPAESAKTQSKPAAAEGEKPSKPAAPEAERPSKPAAAEVEKPSKSAAAASGAYVVQVAALSDAAKAKQLQKKMSGAGLNAYTEVVTTKSGQVTRVRAGPFATREAAEKARAQLKKAGLDGQVVAK